MILYVPPMCHTVVAFGSRILGTQTSLAPSCIGDARIIEEAERRRVAKVVVNIIVKGISVGQTIWNVGEGVGGKWGRG